MDESRSSLRNSCRWKLYTLGNEIGIPGDSKTAFRCTGKPFEGIERTVSRELGKRKVDGYFHLHSSGAHRVTGGRISEGQEAA